MDQPDLTAGAVIAGKYKLERLLGQGGMGRVFAAHNTVTGKRVAIKCMNREIAADQEASQRFLREARASARIRHPNVVDVYDVLWADGALYLIMEILDGEPLSLFLARESTPLPRLVRLLLAAMRGVSAAHREGVIHRDVKPENIFLAQEGDDTIVPKVLDFGISKLEGTQETALTAPGAALGTLLYMCTEQLNGSSDVDGRADVYSFGVMLYQALTGRLPFEADTFSALVFKIATEQPVPVKQLRPDVPGALAHVIERAMAKRREDRLPSIDAFIAELEPYADESKYRDRLTRPCSWVPPRPSKSAAPLPDAATVVANPTPFVTSRPSRMGRPSSRIAGVLLFAVFCAAFAAASWWTNASRNRALTTRNALRAAAVAPAEPPRASTVSEPAPVVSPVSLPEKPLAPVPPPVLARPAAPRTPTRTPAAPTKPAPHAEPQHTAPPPPPSAAPVVVLPPAGKRPGCNPKYYFDEQGEKHWKPQCF